MNFLSAQYNTLKISHLILFFLNVSQELCRMWATHKAESLTRLPLLFAHTKFPYKMCHSVSS